MQHLQPWSSWPLPTISPPASSPLSSARPGALELSEPQINVGYMAQAAKYQQTLIRMAYLFIGHTAQHVGS